jgi:hypothetical protein
LRLLAASQPGGKPLSLLRLSRQRTNELPSEIDNLPVGLDCIQHRHTATNLASQCLWRCVKS